VENGQGTVEDMVTESSFWRGRRVLVTGHTGFKGSWLSLWLHQLGAEVHGLALDAPTEPNLFEVANVAGILASDSRVDIRDSQQTNQALASIQPTVLFHMAAQPLVPYSYEHPIETFAVNVMGTAHVLQAARIAGSVKAIVVVTTDKCYANKDTARPYRETDELGGFDPYSSSKACAELVTSAFRSSYLGAAGIATASARAGNVIGGGDWASARLLPDCIRAHFAGQTLKLRFQDAVRPWQHVLEPLAGYLRLAERLHGERPEEYCQAWNFGPDAADSASVRDVVTRVSGLLDGKLNVESQPIALHETALLQLDSAKARAHLQWQPRWNLQQAIANTVGWYLAWSRREDMRRFSLQQIAQYERALRP
jgi:CDP-glucose 4,6-dehydratase